MEEAQYKQLLASFEGQTGAHLAESLSSVRERLGTEDGQYPIQGLESCYSNCQSIRKGRLGAFYGVVDAGDTRVPDPSPDKRKTTPRKAKNGYLIDKPAVVVAMLRGTQVAINQARGQTTVRTLTRSMSTVSGRNAILSTMGKTAQPKVGEELKVETTFYDSQYHDKSGNGPWHIQRAIDTNAIRNSGWRDLAAWPPEANQFFWTGAVCKGTSRNGLTPESSQSLAIRNSHQWRTTRLIRTSPMGGFQLTGSH